VAAMEASRQHTWMVRVAVEFIKGYKQPWWARYAEEEGRFLLPGALKTCTNLWEGKTWVILHHQ
jgi:hypothetical protein